MVALIRRELVTDPLHADWYDSLSARLSALGHLDEGDAAIHKVIELQSAALNYHEQLAMIEIQRGEP